MRILIIGYGKMGQSIEQIAIERGHSIAGIVDKDNKNSISDYSGDLVDVAIEFTNPDAAYGNLKQCIKQGIPVISGTTGWLDHYKEFIEYCNAQKGTFLYASNFSLGVNLFFKLNQYLAKLMNGMDYKVAMEEIHHTQKLDAPSGTAITLAEGIIDQNQAYEKWHLDTESAAESIPITAKRIDQTPGTHSVVYNSEIDSIEIKHTAHTRKGFALGAVLVAEWISDKSGVLTMDDFLKLN